MKLSKLIAAVFVGVLAASGLAGCASMSTVQNASVGSGPSRAFDADYDRTNAATLTALQGMNVSITSSSENERGTTYLVSKSMNAFSWGEVGRVIVARSEGDSTTVHVNWEKRSQLQITGTSESEFSGQLFVQIANRL